MKAILLATAAAIAVQPLVFFLLVLSPAMFAGTRIPPNDLFGMPLLAALFAVPFVVVLGIPAHRVLRRCNCLTWWSLGSLGILMATLPAAISGFPEYPGFSLSGNWYGSPVVFVVNGEKTFYGWLSYAQDVLFFGLQGLAGALAFFFVWRRLAKKGAMNGCPVPAQEDEENHSNGSAP